MRRLLYVLSSVSFIASFVFLFFLIRYAFSGFLFFLAGAFFLYLALNIGITRKPLIILRRVVVSLAIAGVSFFIVISSVVLSQSGGDAPAPCDYVIVLGAGLNDDLPSLSLKDRLDRTFDYMQSYPESIAIVSGSRGSGEKITEALAMERYLISRGIEKSRIIKEEKARNTNENMIFSLEIIKSRGGEKIGIISSDYHIFRSRLLARKQGIDANMISAKSSLWILRLNYAIREVAALVKALLLGHI